uniref:TlpA family protein disulfide reductase n=1 Tax=candidate division WOR-3 bacterium TaxID=2052148 RepID=A0A7C4Y6T7_UNCW3
MIFLLFNIQNFTLKDFDGKSYDIKEELKGNVVIIDFWASWCKPCIKMMPFLDSIYIKYKNSNLKIFGICVDTKKSISLAKSIWNKNNFSYTPLWDWDNSVMEMLGVKEIPHIFIVYGDGEILYKKEGYDEKEREAFEDTLRKIIVRNIIENSKGGKDE